MPKIALLNNPASRRNRRDPTLAPRLTQILGGLGRRFDSPTLDELDQVAEQIHHFLPQFVAINGGDGTLSRTLGALAKQYGRSPLPTILILRGGTMNTVATTLGLSGRPQDILAKAVQTLRKGTPLKTVALDVLSVNGRLGFIFGLGCFQRFIEIYNRTPHPTPWRGFVLLLKTCAAILSGSALARQLFAPLKLTVPLPAEELMPSRPPVGLAISSVRQIGFGFCPFYLAQTKPGQLHLLALHPPLGAVLIRLPRLYRGKQGRCQALYNLPLTELSLEFAEAQPYMLDGELFSAEKSFDIQCAIRLDFAVT